MNIFLGSTSYQDDRAVATVYSNFCTLTSTRDCAPSCSPAPGLYGQKFWHRFQLTLSTKDVEDGLNLFSGSCIQYCIAKIYKDAPRLNWAVLQTVGNFVYWSHEMDLRQNFEIWCTLYPTLWFELKPTWHPFITFDTVSYPVVSSNPFSWVSDQSARMLTIVSPTTNCERSSFTFRKREPKQVAYAATSNLFSRLYHGCNILANQIAAF